MLYFTRALLGMSSDHWQLIGAHAEDPGHPPACPRAPQISPHYLAWLSLNRTDPGEINPRITRSPSERKPHRKILRTVVCISPRCAQNMFLWSNIAKEIGQFSRNVIT
jgi:hypothetical protein